MFGNDLAQVLHISEEKPEVSLVFLRSFRANICIIMSVVLLVFDFFFTGLVLSPLSDLLSFLFIYFTFLLSFLGLIC